MRGKSKAHLPSLATESTGPLNSDALLIYISCVILAMAFMEGILHFRIALWLDMFQAAYALYNVPII